MNRRRFIVAGTSAVAAASWPSQMIARSTANGSASASLLIHTEQQGAKIPADFTGLSYESAQLAHPGFFSPKNESLIELFRGLGPHGVLRIGGGASEYTIWTPDSTTNTSEDAAAVGPGIKAVNNPDTPVTPLAIRNLAGFLDATGWKLIYGLNFGRGTAGQAAEEGAYVTRIMGSRLIALQIGNEPDGYNRHGLRPPEWGYLDYLKQWNEWAQIIRDRTPSVPLAGPDVAGKTDWFDSFAKQEKGRIVLLTSHYYAGGPPSNPKMNIETLLEPHPGLKGKFETLVRTAAEANVPYRMCEGNSCFHEGKPGVSDVFASALWGADFMLALAQCGVNGINLHGGGNGHYSPIGGSSKAELTARPLYYGMLLFSYFANSSLLPIALDTGIANLSAYAARAEQSRIRVALINKDLKQAATVRINAETNLGKARHLLLTAPSAESKINVTFGGSEVTKSGRWKPKEQRYVHSTKNESLIDLPPGSAAVLLFD